MSIKWNYNGETLVAFDPSHGLLNISGENARNVADLINKAELSGKIYTKSEIDRIFEFAHSNMQKKDLVSYRKTNEITDELIVASMKDHGLENVSYDKRSRQILFEGEPINGAVARNIGRTISMCNYDLQSVNWNSISRFFNRMSLNPSATKTLFRWLSVNDFSIASDGRIVCYRGVDSNYRSSYEGVGGWIDKNGNSFGVPGVEGSQYAMKKKLEYRVGNTVFMKREDCDPDSSQHCSTGIHFGTKVYAESYAGVNGHMMICLVAPEDVVSVPDDDYRKARTCFIEVIGEVGDNFDDSSVPPVSEIHPNDGEQSVKILDATSSKEIQNV